MSCIRLVKQQQLRSSTQTGYRPQLGTFTLPSPFSMSVTNTGTPTSLSTSALWISNQPMTRFSGISSGACCNAWGCMATCWVLSSPCMMGLCCLCELEVSVAQARAHPSASDRAARSVLLFSASSLIASSLIAPFADHCSSCWSASQASQAHRFGLS